MHSRQHIAPTDRTRALATFKFKNDDIKKPETYLDAKLQEKTINGSKCRTMSSVDYINAAVKMLKRP